MARLVNGASLSMGGRDSGGFVVQWYGDDALRETLDSISTDLMAFDDNGNYLGARTAANREMRQAAKKIAQDLLIPQIKRTARSSPVKISRAMAETARAKTDRMVAVQVGAVNPPLSGFRRGVGVKRAGGRTGGRGRDASSRTFRTTLAWGSEFGPKGGRRQPSRGNNIPRGEVNHYKVPRNESGYYVLPAVENVMSRVGEYWDDALDRIFRKYTTRG
jgi:hypothetical protein